MASNKRERELARMRVQRQAERRAAAQAARRQRRKNALAIVGTLVGLAAVALVVVLLSNGKGNKKDTLASHPTPSASASAVTSATPAAVPPGTCAYTAAGKASKAVRGLPPTKPSRTGTVPVTLTTNHGAIALSLDGAKAPCTTGSFAFLAGQKYFDGTHCHRLTTSGIYVLQCGDPSATGGGGPGYRFADENLSALATKTCTPQTNAATPCQVTYPRGTVAMANAGPGTNGSQFFLVYKDSPLGPAYTPFGRITTGLDVLDAIAKAGSTPPADGKPKTDVVIQKATLG